jgi:hypothetical protein
MLNFLHEYWSFIVSIVSIIGVYYADHYKIKTIENELKRVDVNYIALNTKIQCINDNIIKLQTIIEERFKEK